MTVSIKDRVKQSTTTTGTGTITLSSTSSGYQSFSAAFSDGATVYYVIENGNMYEIGVGTYNAGTLSRDTVLKSSSGTSLITLSGRSTVFVAVPADKTIYINDTNKASIGLGNLSNVSLTSPASGDIVTYNGSIWSNGNFTEQIQDAVAASFVAGTGIDISYNDGLNTISVSSSGLLQSALNLSDLSSAATARTNLGLGTAALSNSGDFYLSTNPSGYISASSVAAGYQPLDGDLTSLAAVTGVDTIYYRSATSTWSPVVIGTGILFSGGTLSNTLDLSSYATSTGVAALYTPLSRTITINGSGQDLTSNRSWTVGDLRSDSSYSDPTWLTSLAWSKISGTPTTLAGYGITDGITSSGVAASYVPYTGATGAVDLGSQSLTAGAITTSGQFTNSQGTLTSSTPLTLTQTWNSGATTFTGALINITDTASASASLLQGWQVGGSSKVSLRKDGQMIFYGTGSGLGLAQLTGYNSQWFIYSGGTFQSPLFNCNGWYGMVDGANGGMQFFSGHGIVWSGTGASGTLVRNSLSGDVGLFRDGAGALIQRYSTTAQSFGIANTYTSSTNYEYGCLKWTSNEFRIGTAVGSLGGTPRGLSLGTWNAAGAFTNLLYLSPTTGGVSIYNGSASGTGSFCGAVHSGTANVSGQYAVAFGSSYFTVSGTRSFLIAGDFTTVSGTACFAHGYLPGFDGPTVAGTGNFCTAGGASASTANWGFAHGQSAETRLPGQLVYAAGRFSALADAQATKFILRIKTTDATATTMMLDGSTTRLTIPSGKMMFADIWISGIKSDGSAAATYRRKVAIKNVGGTTSLIGSVETIGTDYEDNVLTDVAITADDTNDALQINVTGIAAETWRWVAVVEGLEIAYGT